MTQRHGIDIVPSQASSSPHAVDAQRGEDVPWWTPSFGEVLAQLGWRWIYFIPAVLALTGILLLPVYRGLIPMALGLWKILIIAVALPTAAAIRAMKTIVQRRKDPFCIHCGYTLLGLPDGHRCPECGRQFSLSVIDEYRRDPHWFVTRWKNMHTMPPADVRFEAGAVRSRKSRDGT